MTQQVNTTISTYLDKVQKSGILITQAYLFGSQATQKNDIWSDIDLCIVSPQFGQEPFKERIMLMNLREGVSYDIEPHPFSVEDIDDISNPLANEIRETGIRLEI